MYGCYFMTSVRVLKVRFMVLSVIILNLKAILSHNFKTFPSVAR